MNTMTKFYLFLAFLFTLVLAAWTNPSLEKHQQEVKENFYMKYENNPIMKALAYTFLDRKMDEVLDERVGVESYTFFSLTKIRVDSGEVRTDGIGIFGHVFLLGNTQMGQ